MLSRLVLVEQILILNLSLIEEFSVNETKKLKREQHAKKLKKWHAWRSWIRASWYNYKYNQQYALYRLNYYSKWALHVSGGVFAQHREHLTVFTASGSVHASCCRLVSGMSWNYFAVSTHPRHQPAATCVNTTRYCKYSQVLPMMGENISRNM
jgi:hypothetical protein